MKKAEVNIYSKVNEIFVSTSVTQKILNDTDNPIEVEVLIKKNLDNIIFSSFYAQIGDSIKFKSKVIKKEKAKEKYNDNISSENASIFTDIDKKNKNKIIVHIGNIPPKQELIFTSEFIKFTESSHNSLEYELFRNLPILTDKNGYYIENDIIKGTIEISMKGKIRKIKKEFYDKLIIKEEKNDQEKNIFIIKYEYDRFENFITQKYIHKSKKFLSDFINNNYPIYNINIPSSKLYIELDSNINLFSQISALNNQEQSFILNYKYIAEGNKNKKKEIKLKPALFIILIDQSDSMSDSSIKAASEGLLLFLQSLPVGSFYQIIGFGTDYETYDKKPKEYKQKNIEESIKIIEALKANKGGTNIYEPLKYIYKLKNDYDKILLPRYIFLLTNGNINNKNETLSLIEKNSNKFSIHSFGIGKSFNKHFIKSAGIIGKGSYSFCNEISKLNIKIVSTLNSICIPYLANLEIKSPLDELNLYKINVNNINIKESAIYKYYYIINKKLENKKINFSMKYTKKKETETKTEELKPFELPQGDQLSKLIINKYILENDSLSEKEKIELALKYQLFIEGTSLFAENELTQKTKAQIQKKEVIREKKEKKIKTIKDALDALEENIKNLEQRVNDIEIKANQIHEEAKLKLKEGDEGEAKRLLAKERILIEQLKQIDCTLMMMEEDKQMLDSTEKMKDISKIIKGNNAFKEVADPREKELEVLKENLEEMEAELEELDDCFEDNQDEDDDLEYRLESLKEELKEKSFVKKQENNNENNYDKKEEEELAMFLSDDFIAPKKESKNEEKEETKKFEKKEEKKEVKKNLEDKEEYMQIINTQNFVEGYWDINVKTSKIKNKYEKEFNLLKGLTGKKIDDTVAMTIIIIYFVYKQNKEFLEELALILKKAKLYIQEKTDLSYDEIIKQAGI